MDTGPYIPKTNFNLDMFSSFGYNADRHHFLVCKHSLYAVIKLYSVNAINTVDTDALPT
jgi:hypothetical protein